MTTHLRILVVLAAAALTAACDESLTTIAGPTPDLEPTFASIQRDIFDSTDSSGRVACINCHRPAAFNFVGRLDLTANVSYDMLVNVPSANQPGAIRVIPFDPANSYLVHKLEGRAGIFGNRMPLNSPAYLTIGQIAIIRRWIEIGAPRN